MKVEVKKKHSSYGWTFSCFAAHSKLQDRARFRINDAFHHDLSGTIRHHDRNTFLVHIHADIFSAGQKGFPPLERSSSALKTCSKRAPFYIALDYR
jgi:hypothetical protein